MRRRGAPGRELPRRRRLPELLDSGWPFLLLAVVLVVLALCGAVK